MVRPLASPRTGALPFACSGGLGPATGHPTPGVTDRGEARWDWPSAASDTRHYRAGAVRPISDDSVPEDGVPGDGVFRVEPSFDLVPVSVVEDADYAGLHVHAIASSAHDAQGAHVVVVAEDVVLAQPESLGPQLTEPLQEPIPSEDVACNCMRAWNVPDDGRINKRSEQFLVAGSERVSRAAVGDCVRMFGPLHAWKDT